MDSLPFFTASNGTLRRLKERATPSEPLGCSAPTGGVHRGLGLKIDEGEFRQQTVEFGYCASLFSAPMSRAEHPTKGDVGTAAEVAMPMKDLDHFKAWLDDLLDTASKMHRHKGSGYPDYADLAEFQAWSAQAESFLLSLLGPDHVYYQRFKDAAGGGRSIYWTTMTQCVQLLRSVSDDLAKGRLVSLRDLVTAEVFGDFLGMADHLLKHDYKDAGASLIGAVLERGLRDVALANGLKLKDRDDLTSLTNKLAEKGVFNRLVQKNLNVWIELRNKADHGQFEEYKIEDVRNMLTGVQTFLSTAI